MTVLVDLKMRSENKITSCAKASLKPRQISTVKTLYNDAGRTADRIVIPMVLLYIESRARLISREKEANTWPGILKGCRASTSRAK